MRNVDEFIKKAIEEGKGKLFDFREQLLDVKNGNAFSKTDDEHHWRNVEKKTEENQNEIGDAEVNNDNTINMRLEELQQRQIPNSTSKCIEI